MDYSTIITWMIIVCLIFVGLIIFAKPVKYILRFLAQGTGGMFLAVFFNFLLAPFNVVVGVNYLTFIVAGLLGAPGFAMLYLVSWMV